MRRIKTNPNVIKVFIKITKRDHDPTNPCDVILQAREKEAKKASRTLFEVGTHKRDKEGDSTLNKPGESSVQSIAEEEEDTDGLAASVDHDTTESRESTTDSSLNQDNQD